MLPITITVYVPARPLRLARSVTHCVLRRSLRAAYIVREGRRLRAERVLYGEPV